MSNADSHAISESYFIGELGLTHWVDREVSQGKAEITGKYRCRYVTCPDRNLGHVRRPLGGPTAVRHESDH